LACSLGGRPPVSSCSKRPGAGQENREAFGNFEWTNRERHDFHITTASGIKNAKHKTINKNARTGAFAASYSGTISMPHPAALILSD
jgi:hypothetical protein